MDPLKFAVVIGLAPWLAWLMVRPRMLTLLSIFLSLIQLNWFSRYFGAPAILNRVSLATAGLLGIRIAVDCALNRRVLSIRRWEVLTPVLWLTLSFLILTLYSNLYNRESLLLGIYELRYYFFGFVTCFGLYFYFKNELSIVLFKQAMVWIGLVQLPFSALKWLAAGGGASRTLDSVSGTFGGYGALVGCQLFVISLVLFEQLVYKKKLLRINNYLLCILLLVPLLLSKSRTFTIFFVFILSFVWMYSSLFVGNLALWIKKTILIGSIGMIFLSLLYFVFWRTNYDLTKQFNPTYVLNYYMRDPVMQYSRYMEGADTSMGRLRAIVEAGRLGARNSTNLFIGYGSGATAEASFLKIAGHYYQAYGPYAGIGRNHFSKTIVEFGICGMGLFVFFFTTIYRRIKAVFHLAPEPQQVFTLLLFCLILLSLYDQTLTAYFFSFTLAFFLATVQVEIDNLVIL